MEQVSIPISLQLKEQMDSFLENLGMTWTEFLSESFEKQTAYEKELLEAMLECEEMLKNPNEYPSYHSMEELKAALESDDE